MNTEEQNIFDTSYYTNLTDAKEGLLWREDSVVLDKEWTKELSLR